MLGIVYQALNVKLGHTQKTSHKSTGIFSIRLSEKYVWIHTDTIKMINKWIT